MTAKTKREILALMPFVGLIFWLIALFIMLYLNKLEFIIPLIVTFFILNLGAGLYIRKAAKLSNKPEYNKYLKIQTVFLLMWCPILGLIFYFGEMDLLPIWTLVLIVFYVLIGFFTGKCAIKEHKEKKTAMHKKKKEVKHKKKKK